MPYSAPFKNKRPRANSGEGSKNNTLKQINIDDQSMWNNNELLKEVRAESVLSEVHDIISAVKHRVLSIGFTTDMWTSLAGDSYCSLTVKGGFR